MIRAFRYRLPLRTPVNVLGSPLKHRQGILLNDGLQWSEAAPLPGLSEDRLEEVLLALRDDAPRSLPSLAFARDSLRVPWTACRVPVNALLQGPLAQIQAKCRDLANSGFTTVKLKVGQNVQVQRDLERVTLVRDLLRNDQRLRLDANRAWTFSAAVEFATGLAARGIAIDYIEEPLRDPSRLEELHSSTGLRYALDESIVEQRTLTAFPQAAALIVKPTAVGARDQIEHLAQTGKPLVFSAAFESGVGISRIAQLATEFATGVPAGLDTYSYLASDVLTQRLRMEDGELHVPGNLSVRITDLEELVL